MRHKIFQAIKSHRENSVLALFILLSLIISFLPVHYGYFRDTLYYIALSKHLAFGYVDVPPLMPLCIALIRFLFGNSLFAMQIIPAVFGVIILVLTREIVKIFNGRLFAQALALLCVLLAPVYVFSNSTLTYDSFDRLFWTLCLYALSLLFTTKNKKYWIYFGIFAGLGLLSKFTMLWLGMGIVIALPFTSQRKYFASRSFWLAGLMTLLIVSPYLIWIAQHQFLTVEYFANYAHETKVITALGFIKDQMIFMNVLIFPIWVSGLYYFLFDRVGRKFRFFGLIYLIIAAVCIIQSAKFYVISPYYPVLFAGGAILTERFSAKLKSHWFKIICIVLIAASGMITLPIVRPVLPVQTLIKYMQALPWLQPAKHSATERLTLSTLPQLVADQFGWEEMAAKVAKIYYALPKHERENTFIVARNYGEASAIYFYRKKYHLPVPISQYLQSYVWGYRNLSKTSYLILVGYDHGAVKNLKHSFKTVRKVGEIYNQYAMPYENVPIYLCYGFKKPVKQVWEAGKLMHM